MKKETRTAAIYLRSSKDRKDVSIDAQRRELQNLATSQSIIVVKEYSDVVESAKDENRPGFQRLLYDLKSSSRTWTTLLVVDTSRLSRRRYMAQVFKHEAKKRNIQILYSKLPESDPIADMVIVGVMEVFDELHSLMSKEKGLAGMAENVRQGYRAGGRAPKGYQLKKIPTGAMREGEAVTKSKLEPSKDAAVISRYLKMRAEGISRTRILNDLDLPIAKTSAVGMEWNALTYAGHTVWNVHNEKTKGSGYKGGVKHRPRSEWVIAENTHEALITTEEAEAILTQLEKSSNSRSRRTPASYLLTGILKTPKGEPWHGNGGKRYATPAKSTTENRKVCQHRLEKAVLDQVMNDLLSPDFVKQLTREAMKYREAHQVDPAQNQRTDAAELETRISKMLEMASDLENPAPALREVDKLERARNALLSEIGRLETEYTAASMLDNISEAKIELFLRGIAENMESLSREALKDFLSSVIGRVTLDPATHECQIDYRIGINLGDKVASPRGFEPLLPG
jgi:site-specific DNA recombinase